ncbi:MAG: polyprenyl diphosphate synthase [Candidatus Babeliaceae bacterium]|jgi:undecaprenyl diphosphate synthase
MIKKLVILACISVVVACVFVYKKRTYSTSSIAHYDDKPTKLKHLAIIMDGNRRWAKKNSLKPWLGHKQGIEPVKTTIEFCIKKKIPYLTLYAFSLENFKRSSDELDYLFNIIAKEVSDSYFDTLIKNNVRVRFIGRRSSFPQQLIENINAIEAKSAHNTGLTLNIMFCYGGRQELVDAIKNIVASGIMPENITEDTIAQHLWTHDMPDPELVIRTGYTHRLSNFLPYQSVYSELYFIDCYWPEITVEHLHKAVDYYESIERNFGA